MIIDNLIDKIVKLGNPTAVGLDTCVDYLPDEMREKCVSLETCAEQIFEFNKNIIDNIKDIVPAVKVQVAYYEQYGEEGMKALAELLDMLNKMAYLLLPISSVTTLVRQQQLTQGHTLEE